MTNSIKVFFSRYFGRDYKWFWKYNTPFGRYYQKFTSELGLKLMKLSRKLIRIGGGYCSWCGAKQTKNTGLHMSISRKGMRCGCLPKSCGDMPYV